MAPRTNVGGSLGFKRSYSTMNIYKHKTKKTADNGHFRRITTTYTERG